MLHIRIINVALLRFWWKSVSGSSNEFRQFGVTAIALPLSDLLSRTFDSNSSPPPVAGPRHVLIVTRHAHSEETTGDRSMATRLMKRDDAVALLYSCLLAGLVLGVHWGHRRKMAAMQRDADLLRGMVSELSKSLQELRCILAAPSHRPHVVFHPLTRQKEASPTYRRATG